MTITISLSSEAFERLRERAMREGMQAEAMAASVLTDALEWEASDREEAVEGIRRGLADFDAGKFRPLDEVIAEKREKYGARRHLGEHGDSDLGKDTNPDPL